MSKRWLKGKVLRPGSVAWSMTYAMRTLALRAISIQAHLDIAYMRGRIGYWTGMIPSPVLNNMRVAFRERYNETQINRIARRHIEFCRRLHLPRVLPGLPGFSLAGIWRVDGLEHLDNALALERGAILVTAHMGYPRLIPPILRALGYEVKRVRSGRVERIEKSHKLEESLESGNRFNNRLLKRTPIGAALKSSDDIVAGMDVRPIFAALSLNKTVLIAGEGMRASHFARLSLLGQAYPFPTGYMKIAMQSGAAVLPVFATDADTGAHRIRVDIRPALKIDPKASVEANVEEYAHILNEELWRAPHLWTRWTVKDVFEKAMKWSEADLDIRYGGHWKDA